MKWIVTGLAIFAVVLAAFFAAPRVQGWYDARNAESTLLALPVYRVLKEHESETYARLLDEYRRAARDKSRFDIFTSIANSEISAAATRRVAHASQDALLALMNDMLANMKRLQKQSGEQCFRYLFPRIAGPADISRTLDEPSQRHTLDLMAEVIRTSAVNPVAVPPAADVQDKLQPVIDAVSVQFGADTQLMSHPEAPGADRAKICNITIALNERVLQLPPADATAVLRTLTQQ
jgi:hypothetical protein